VQFLLAKTYFALKQHDLSLQIFSRLRIDPDIGAISALHSGTLNINAKKYDAALEDFDIGLRHEKINQAVFLELKYRMAEAYLKQGELSTALRLWKEIDSLDPNYKDVSEKISRYREVNTNRFLQTFLMAASSEFITLCRRIAARYYANSNTKLVNISLKRGIRRHSGSRADAPVGRPGAVPFRALAAGDRGTAPSGPVRPRQGRSSIQGCVRNRRYVQRTGAGLCASPNDRRGGQGQSDQDFAEDVGTTTRWRSSSKKGT
jgi:hypothetical protein